MIFVISSLLIALILILVLLFLVAYQKKMALQRMRLQEMENSYQLELLQATIDGQERERRRIASDLHDDVGALLSALKLNVMHLEGLPETPPAQQEFLGQTRDMLENGLIQVRRISHDLLPPTLCRFGLRKALEELVNQLQSSGEMECRLTFNVFPERLPSHIELPIFRIIQELVANTLKHADANVITIQATTVSEQWSIEYRDNGKGMSPNTHNHGLGINNMHSRLKTIGGVLEFHAPPGGGFGARIQIPKTESHDT